MDSDSGGRERNATRGWSDRPCCAYADAGMEGRERDVCASSVAGVWPGPSVTLGARAERNWRSARAPKTSGSARDSKSWCPGSSADLAIHTQAARDMLRTALADQPVRCEQREGLPVGAAGSSERTLTAAPLARLSRRLSPGAHLPTTS